MGNVWGGVVIGLIVGMFLRSVLDKVAMALVSLAFNRRVRRATEETLALLQKGLAEESRLAGAGFEDVKAPRIVVMPSKGVTH
jgi:hypothetical protein